MSLLLGLRRPKNVLIEVPLPLPPRLKGIPVSANGRGQFASGQAMDVQLLQQVVGRFGLMDADNLRPLRSQQVVGNIVGQIVLIGTKVMRWKYDMPDDAANGQGSVNQFQGKRDQARGRRCLTKDGHEDKAMGLRNGILKGHDVIKVPMPFQFARAKLGKGMRWFVMRRIGHHDSASL